MSRYPRAAKLNTILDVANCYVADLGAPALADNDKYVVSTVMKNATYTLANSGLPGDGLARNVTVKRTVVATGADTPGKITVTGIDLDGLTITEEIIPGADTVVVPGVKAFKQVTSVVGSLWTVQGGNDTIEVGFGTRIGLPRAIRSYPPVAAATQLFLAYLGTVSVAPVVTWDVDELCKNTVDCSSGTYNGTKRLMAFIAR